MIELLESLERLAKRLRKGKTKKRSNLPPRLVRAFEVRREWNSVLNNSDEVRAVLDKIERYVDAEVDRLKRLREGR
jgi:guanylate kinase